MLQTIQARYRSIADHRKEANSPSDNSATFDNRSPGGDFSCVQTYLIALEGGDTRQTDRQTVTLSRIGQGFAHIGIEGTVNGKNTAVCASMHDNQHCESWPVP